MRDLKENIKKVLKPALALIVYNQSNSYDGYYIESRQISKTGKMGAAAPLSEFTLKKLLKFYNDEYIKKEKEENVNVGGIIPEHLLYCLHKNGGVSKLIWYRKAEQKQMYFTENLHIPEGMAWVPPMLYVMSDGKLKVFALGEENRPNNDTVLFIPPYHNCSTGGSVCLGSAKAKLPKNLTFDNLIDYWERLFWGSKFSRNGNADIIGNINLIWKKQINNPDKMFDASILKPTKSTFKDLLK